MDNAASKTSAQGQRSGGGQLTPDLVNPALLQASNSSSSQTSVRIPMSPVNTKLTLPLPS